MTAGAVLNVTTPVPELYVYALVGCLTLLTYTLFLTAPVTEAVKVVFPITVCVNLSTVCGANLIRMPFSNVSVLPFFCTAVVYVVSPIIVSMSNELVYFSSLGGRTSNTQ